VSLTFELTQEYYTDRCIASQPASLQVGMAKSEIDFKTRKTGWLVVNIKSSRPWHGLWSKRFEAGIREQQVPGREHLHSLWTMRAASNPRLAGLPEAIQVADHREYHSNLYNFFSHIQLSFVVEYARSRSPGNATQLAISVVNPGLAADAQTA
jgi:hypothetical protein